MLTKYMRYAIGLVGVILMAVALMFPGVQRAIATNATSLSTMNADTAYFCAGQAGTLTNPCIAQIRPTGLLYSNVASVATATGTGVQTLGTYSLPANALDVTGRRLRIYGSFSTAANTNTKGIELVFGSKVLSVTQAISGLQAVFQMDVLKTGANTQVVSGLALFNSRTLSGNSAAVTPISTTDSETDTAAITIAAKAQDSSSSAADVTMNDFFVQYMN